MIHDKGSSMEMTKCCNDDGFDDGGDGGAGVDHAVCDNAFRWQPLMDVVDEADGNAGDDVDLLITLDFHEINSSVDDDTLIAIESETFYEDAADRRGMGQEVKFRSG